MSRNQNLALNQRVSVNGRYLVGTEVARLLEATHNFRQPGSRLFGTICNRVEEGNKVFYGIEFNALNGRQIQLSAACISTRFVEKAPVEARIAAESNRQTAMTTDVAAVNDEASSENNSSSPNKEEVSINETINAYNEWVDQEVVFDARATSGATFVGKSRINMENSRVASPADYFLRFLPQEHFLDVINTSARSAYPDWAELNWNEFLLWITMCLIMTMFSNADLELFWGKSQSPLGVSFTFADFMTIERFKSLISMFTFEIFNIAKIRCISFVDSSLHTTTI